MNKYGTVYSNFWMDKSIKKLPVESLYVYLYLISSPHSNSAGLYRLPVAYAVEDLGMTKECYLKALSDLESEDYVFFDEDIVFIRTFLKYNKIQNEKHAKGTWSQVKMLPLNLLTVEFVHSCIEYAPQVIPHIDGETIRFLYDNHITRNGIDISNKLAVLSPSYSSLISYKDNI